MEDSSLRIDAILMIDNYSRLNCNVDIAEIKRYGVDLISDFREVFDTDYAKKPIIILEGYLRSTEGLSDMILHKKMLNLSYIYIGTDAVFLRQVEKYAKTFNLCADVVNYNLLFSVVNDDDEAKVPFIEKPSLKIGRIAEMLAENSMMDVNIRDVAKAYITTSRDYLELSDKYALTSSLLEASNSLNRNKDEQIRVLSEKLDEILRQTVLVNDSLQQYEFLCRKNIYNKVDLSTFRNRPDIIYFKEFNDFLMLNSLIYILAESIKMQFGRSVKVLRILDTKTPMKLKQMPPYYKGFINGVYSKPDIHVNDYLFTHNGYSGILSVLCENQSSTDFLIIVDSKLADDTVIGMDNVLRYDLCRDYRKIERYKLNPDRTIVNGMDEYFDLSWSYLEEYNDLTESDRFLYLSGRPVIESIISTIGSTFGI